MEEDLPNKWRAKENQELQFSSLKKETLKQQRSKETKKGIHNGKRIHATRRANDIYSPNKEASRYIKQVLNDI